MSVYVIAEAGVNHNGNLDLALKLVAAAKQAGCDAVKFQAFKASDLVDPLASKAAYQMTNTKEGGSESQYQMLKKLELDEAAFSEIAKACQDIGISFLCTPFSIACAKMIAPWVSRYKVSSGDLTYRPLLKFLADCRKPLILSSGMATLGEIEQALEWIYQVHSEAQLTLLHCTSNYPCRLEEINLRAMQTLAHTFKLPVGYSDHSTEVSLAIAAVALGAEVLEKHFTLDKDLPGPDHKASATVQELEQYVRAVRRTEVMLGDGRKRPTIDELETKKVARRGLVWSQDLPIGTLVTEAHLDMQRPEQGLSAEAIDTIIGKTLQKNVVAKTRVQLNQFL